MSEYTHALSVSRVSERMELDALSGEWSRLLGVSASDSIFISLEWIGAWWDAYGSGKQLDVLLFRREGILVGVAPLYRTRARWLGMFSLRLLQLLGDGSNDSDYLDLVAARGEEEAVAAALFDYLRDRDWPWHILALNEVPSLSPMLKAIKSVARQRGLFVVERLVPCTYAELPPSWDTYLARLKPRMRTKTRSLLKKIASNPRLTFRLLDDPALIDAWLESLYRLHEARWGLDGQSGVFVRPGKRRFYQLLSPRLLASGLLRFYGLFDDGAPIALQYCFAWRNAVLLLQEGFDPAYADEGAGNMLRARVFQDCVEKGVKVYDFLAGVAQHKLLWGGTVKHTSRLLVANRRAHALAHVYGPLAKERLKQAVRRLLPDALLDRLRRSARREITPRQEPLGAVVPLDRNQ